MNTFKTLALAALLGAGLIGVPAIAADRAAGFVAGAMARADGITLPAPAPRQPAATPYGPSSNAGTSRVQGSFLRSDDGRVLPAEARTASVRAASDAPPAAAASTAPADERLFGAFVRHNGIALPAVPNRGAGVRDADGQAVAARSAH